MKIRPEDLVALGLDRYTSLAIARSVQSTESSITVDTNELETLVFSALSSEGAADQLRLKCDALELMIMTQPDYMGHINKLERKINELEALVWQ